jgi:hypothetical protein
MPAWPPACAWVLQSDFVSVAGVAPIAITSESDEVTTFAGVGLAGCRDLEEVTRRGGGTLPEVRCVPSCSSADA